jgi:hypothetical protein
MECLSCVVVFGALLSERSPHLKRQVNIVFLLLIIIIQGYLFAYFILLSLVSGFLQLYSLYTWLCFKFKG